MANPITPVFFKNQAAFRKWLEKNHNQESELLVGFYKVNSGKANMSWSQSVDEALSFGWIDGIRRSIDEDSYCIRFTPRKPDSIWSEINIKKAEKLIEQGLMNSRGLELFMNRKPANARLYSYENKPDVLPPEFEKIFRLNSNAWEFFSSSSTSYKKTIYFWILSAKQESTRLARLNKLISESENKKRVF
jgi:uncharacterized protein YdeI (YjbR/CyaY-like superfamily)